MLHLRDPSRLPPTLRGGLVAMGNFDGVHLGHQAVIGKARDAARLRGVAAGIITFEPHPRQIFKPTEPPFRLTTWRGRYEMLARLGLDFALTLQFTADFARWTADEFVERVLIAGLGVSGIVVGADFCCGRYRQGNVAYLAELGLVRGYAVLGVPQIVRAEAQGAGEPFSSTAIRAHLRAGRLIEAERLLGRPWTIDGPVVHGDKRGRLIGFPTANLRLGRLIRPPYGVYAVRATWEEAGQRRAAAGVANLGTRPTVDGSDERLEVHLFDYDGDLYGKRLTVGLVQFIRPEQRFESFEALKEQIAQDVAMAREVLGGELTVLYSFA